MYIYQVYKDLSDVNRVNISPNLLSEHEKELILFFQIQYKKYIICSNELKFI
jgi:hypothetical protein